MSISSAQTHTFSVLRAFIDCIWVLALFLRLSAELHLLCFVLKQLVGGGMGQGDERRRERRLGSLEVLSLHRSHHAARRFIWRFKINYVTLQDLDISYMVSVFYSSEQTIVTIVFFSVCLFFRIPKRFQICTQLKPEKKSHTILFFNLLHSLTWQFGCEEALENIWIETSVNHIKMGQLGETARSLQLLNHNANGDIVTWQTAEWPHFQFDWFIWIHEKWTLCFETFAKT